ncbi:hypothetical protein [Helicobacter sp. MIT 05-5294]|uniref:hypothetical protein n=1 Tax=Helicobacter sp. MIT 05-5294 TaxID=1548150 RepID=UPI00051F8F4C|nr:hypothetical protein [Helicobacter sp. MIT 05-5294]TLD85679.1 hypothetical protein LS69_008530 [Helicobacter sp. MIT 05-5294]
MSTIELCIRQEVRVLTCMIIMSDLVFADNNLQECIKTHKGDYILQIQDLHNIKNIHINKSKLLSEKYFGLDEACKKWEFDNRTLKDFF